MVLGNAIFGFGGLLDAMLTILACNYSEIKKNENL